MCEVQRIESYFITPWYAALVTTTVPFLFGLLLGFAAFHGDRGTAVLALETALRAEAKADQALVRWDNLHGFIFGPADSIITVEKGASR